MLRARDWAIRCRLELDQHESAAFTTLTYDDQSVPPTLDKKHLQLWLKRMRKALGPKRPLRFFASGEYGETTERPHFHALLYGVGAHENTLIESTWGMGYTMTADMTPARIAYVAGYCQKKIGFKRRIEERVDPATGEVYQWQPPFLQMSRRPGIGGDARKHTNSWREPAGPATPDQRGGHRPPHPPVPRFYSTAWKAQASSEDLEQLEYEKETIALRRGALDNYTLEATEKIAVSEHTIKGNKRKLS